MGRFRQTELEAHKGNALQCCVAAVFEEDELDNVPNFIAQPDVYQSLSQYLASKGFALLKITLLEDGSVPRSCQFYGSTGMPCLLAGWSPRSNPDAPHRHVVVGQLGQDGEVARVFDPHPSDEYLAGPALWLGVFIRV